MNRFFIPLLIICLGGCHYSPWETDIDCRDYYLDNLVRLAEIETATAGQQAFAVALLADLHNDLDDLQLAVDRINQREDVTFTLVMGDLTDQGLALEFEWACKALIKLKTPRLYVLGNHDALSFGQQIFLENFAPFDYSFRFKDVKFILYNDNAYEFQTAPDYDFLAEQALVQTGEVRRMTVAVSHVPPLADIHSEAEAASLRQFLFEQGFNLSLHGHVHRFYYWIDEYGIPHHNTARVEDGQYGMLFIGADNQISLQNCAQSCADAVLE